MITIGLTQFCAIEYISADLAQLEKILRERFDNLLGDISSFNEDHMSIIIKEKKIMQWGLYRQTAAGNLRISSVYKSARAGESNQRFVYYY